MVANKDKYFYGSSGTQGLKFYEQIGLGAASGALKIGEGIAELGAGFSDYAFDTDFLEYLEKNYPKINENEFVAITNVCLLYTSPSPRD